MKNLLLIGLLALVGVQCKSSSESMSPSGCASEKPMLLGKWIMVEFRYYGGCCPVIADSTWKKAEENTYFVEFTADSKLKITNNIPGGNGITAVPTQSATNYTFDGKELTLEEQILGGGLWNKKAGVPKLTTNELILTILVGKEGETNARKFVRACQ